MVRKGSPVRVRKRALTQAPRMRGSRRFRVAGLALRRRPAALVGRMLAVWAAGFESEHEVAEAELPRGRPTGRVHAGLRGRAGSAPRPARAAFPAARQSHARTSRGTSWGCARGARRSPRSSAVPSTNVASRIRPWSNSAALIRSDPLGRERRDRTIPPYRRVAHCARRIRTDPLPLDGPLEDARSTCERLGHGLARATSVEASRAERAAPERAQHGLRAHPAVSSDLGRREERSVHMVMTDTVVHPAANSLGPGSGSARRAAHSRVQVRRLLAVAYGHG
jgi:hypothetical protein